MSDPLVNVIGRLPETAETIEVAPGILWLRMSLPFALNHINLWGLEDGDGWTLVDTGINREETTEAWQALFDGPLSGRPVKRLIVTHFHPDHMGLAGWLTEKFGIEMWTTETEWQTATTLYYSEHSEELVRHSRMFYHAAGFSKDLMAAVEGRGNPYPTRVSAIPRNYHKIAEGDTIDIGGRGWKVMIGTGHSPEHACLYCADAGVLISGDQILPKITPNVSVWPQHAQQNPLALFLDSLKSFSHLPDDTLTLPSHNWPFLGLIGRLEIMAHHHDERLDDVARACSEPLNAFDVLKHLFKRELDEHQLFFAIGESLAHLHYLMGQGRIECEANADGVDLFRAVS